MSRPAVRRYAASPRATRGEIGGEAADPSPGEGAVPHLEKALQVAGERWRARYPRAVPPEVVEDSLAALGVALRLPPGSPVDEGIREPLAHIEIRQLLLALVRRALLEERGPGEGDRAEFTHGPEEASRQGELLSCIVRIEEVAEKLEVIGEAAVDAGLSGPRARELLAEIGHDLRSPLTSVLFLSEVLAASPGIREDRHQRRQLGLIHSAAVTMITLVNNFMEVARSQSSVEEANPSVFSLSDLLEGLLRTLRPLADEKGIELEIQNSVSGPDRRRGYPVSLSRVLLNLGTNAIKFTEEGRVLVRASEPAPGLVEIEVIDTGPGLPSTQARSLEEVFEPSATGSGIHFSGSGLGLVIVRKLLRRMGSELVLESGPEGGTRVAFTLSLERSG